MRPRIFPRGLLGRGCVPKDGLCPSGSQGGYSLLKENVPPGPPKEKRGDATVPTPLLAQRGGLRPSPLETPPGQGNGHHALPIKSRSLLPAAPIGVPCRTASPHLEVQHSPACKEDAPCSLFRCRCRSFAERAALSNARSAERETEGVLSVPGGLLPDRHGVPGWTCAAPRPCHAGTDRFLSRTVENRIPQTCAPPQVWTQALFFSTAAAAAFLLARQKKSGGRILCGTQPPAGAGIGIPSVRYPPWLPEPGNPALPVRQRRAFSL